jgi:Leucine Rich repeats (2 copies)
MPLFEAVTINAGVSLARLILTLWVKDSSLDENITSGLVDLLQHKTEDVPAQGKENLPLEAIGKKVGENLLPLFQLKDAKLNEESRTAVAYAVAETLNKAKLPGILPTRGHLESTELEKSLLAASPQEFQKLSQNEQTCYLRIIKEASAYSIDIASQLSSLTDRTLADLLKGESQIVEPPEEMLRALQQGRMQLDPMMVAERLATLTSLTSLDLSESDQISDLTPLASLASLTSLTSLNLSNCEIRFLTPLAALTNLTSLDLSYSCSGADLRTDERWVNWRNELNDLTPLASLTNLTSLDLPYRYRISDLTPLASLTNLTSLNLTGCVKLTDLTPLASLTNLTSLNLAKCYLPTSLLKALL